MNRFILVCAIVLAMCVRVTSANDKPLSNQEMRSLVKALVSPNPEPKIGGSQAEYPAKYDHEAQDRVLDAWFKLQECGAAAFPILLDSLDDDRYSFTEDGGALDRNWTVGEACRDMIDLELQPFRTYYRFKDDDGPRIPRYIYHFKLDTPDGAKKWWKTHKDKTLRELQIEVLEWVIADLPKEKAYAEIRTKLERDLAKLRAGKEPLEPNVPWSR
jgi:hypothetical protein